MLSFRTTECAWYVQDDMKLRSNFSLRPGLRHEFTNGWNEVAGRCLTYRYDAPFLIQTNPIVGTSLSDGSWKPRSSIRDCEAAGVFCSFTAQKGFYRKPMIETGT